ncbi:MAG: hypothetical protein ABJG42_20515 [Vibrio splendidus]
MTLLTLAATGLAGQKLWDVSQDESTSSTQIIASQTQRNEPQPPTPARQPLRWPALFGELAPPAPPQPPTPPEPPAPPPEAKPPAPPLESLGYQVKGIVRAGDSVWGLVSHPTGEQLVRVGQELAAGVKILRIDEDGLWIDNGADEPALLAIQP